MLQVRRLTLLVTIVILVLLPIGIVLSAEYYLKGLSEKTPMIVDKQAGEIRLLAVLQPKAFGKGWFKQLPGHHAVTWKGGKKADEALLATYTSDSEVYDAMISIGAKPGNNLTQAVWDERKDEDSKAPETRVEGSPVDVLVWWEGLPEPLPLTELLKDPGTKGIDLRFGGNKALIPIWKSGCIVCLQSCPGAKISNHQYTIRDYVQGRATFTVNISTVPKGERKAVVFIRLRK
jgi:hypothetical protein